MFRAHVLIVRRSKLHYTASGIITPIRCDDTRGCVIHVVHKVNERVRDDRRFTISELSLRFQGLYSMTL